MECVLVRHGEIATKSAKVRSDMVKVLRQRVEDRLDFEDITYESVQIKPGRIICRGVEDSKPAARVISELPGVASSSPVYATENSLESIKNISGEIEVGTTFGIDANTSGQTNLDSNEVERELGDYFCESTDATVDLDNPETWVRIDVRSEEAFVFDQVFKGPQGFPAGTGSKVAALISGGIDSPVAAYEMMKKGEDIIPVYFYNKPIAAEDHLIRFKSVVRKLKRFNPSKNWDMYIVDMEEVNKTLLDKVNKGRMILHREIMFKVAEEILSDDISGIATGESLAQKSSQTARNLEKTSSAVETTIFRPLLTRDKYGITEQAREIGTFEEAKIDSACRSLSPTSPATRISEEHLENIEKKVEIDKLVEKAVDSSELHEM